MGSRDKTDRRSTTRSTVRSELVELSRQMAISAAIRERFTPKRLMDKAEELLDAQKMVILRTGGGLAQPDNAIQLGTLKLLIEHYNHQAEADDPIDVDAVDMFRSPAVLGAAKKLIAQQEAEIERLQLQTHAVTANADADTE